MEDGPITNETTANILMPTKANKRRPRSPNLPPPPPLTSETDIAVKDCAPLGELRVLLNLEYGLLDKANFAVIMLRSWMHRQRHAGRSFLDIDAFCGRMGLHKLSKVAEHGLGHGIDGVSAQPFARHEEADHRRGLDLRRLAFISAVGNHSRDKSGIAYLQHRFLRNCQHPDRHG